MYRIQTIFTFPDSIDGRINSKTAMQINIQKITTSHATCCTHAGRYTTYIHAAAMSHYMGLQPEHILPEKPP